MDPMGKIGRNDPCPCGSGKKHKKCCLETEQVVQGLDDEQLATLERVIGEDPAYLESVDELSNRVVALVRRGRLDEAEAVCHELLERFPDMPDGLERLGFVHENRGNNKLAADYYRRAAAFESKTYNLDPEAKAELLKGADSLDPPARP